MDAVTVITFARLFSDSGSSVDPAGLARYGIAGVIAGIAGVVIRWLYQRSAADRDRERAQLIKAHDDDKAGWVTERAELIGAHDDDKTAWAQQIALERARADRLEGKLSELNDMVRGQTMKALEEASRAVSDTIAYLRSSGR